MAVEVFNRDILRQAARSFPLVALDSMCDLSDVSVIDFDHHAATHMAVKYLFDLGHRRIGYFGRSGMRPTRDPAVKERVSGYRAAMARLGLGIDPVWRYDYFGKAPLEDTFRQWAGTPREKRPTALVAADGFWLAINLWREGGVSVPGQVSIVGIGAVESWEDYVRSTMFRDEVDADPPLSGWLPSPYPADLTELIATRPTMVHLPSLRMGREGMVKLLEMLDQPGSVPRRLIIEPRMVIGHTTAPPPGG